MRRSKAPETSPSLTEYALVVIVMGAIGLVGVPRRPDSAVAAQQARLCAETRGALSNMRGAVEQYLDDHGRLPGHGRRGLEPHELFTEQITSRTTPTGALPAIPWDPYASFGPYLLEIPANPLNGKSTVRVLGLRERMPEEADDSTGWLYNPRTGVVKSNVAGDLPGCGVRAYDL